jgi:hypothetical protein
MTRCNRDRVNNVWIEGGNPETGEGGVCLLDNMTDQQIIWIIERDERAREDLIRVTDDVHLQEIARSIARLPTRDDPEPVRGMTNTSVPFYSAFGGRPPFAQ